MPRNQLTKDELRVKVLSLKNQLSVEDRNYESKQLAEKYLNEVLFFIEQHAR